MTRPSFLLIALSLIACDGDPAPVDGGGAAECFDIIAACHEVDEGTSTAIAECHDAAHEGQTEVCIARHDECVALCEAAAATDAGAGADASTDDAAIHDHDGGDVDAH